MRDDFDPAASHLANLVGWAVSTGHGQGLPPAIEFSAWIEKLLRRHGCETFYSGLSEPETGERDRGLLRHLLKMAEITYRRLLDPWPAADADLIARFRSVAEGRPAVLEDYAQAPIDLESSLRRASEVRRVLGPGPHSVLLVGDDDLTSLALALTDELYRVWVIDIDDRLLEFISKRASEMHADLMVERVDLLQDRPGFHLMRRFDAVITDPVCEPEACLSFLRFAAECLSARPLSRVFWSDHPEWTVGHAWILASLGEIGLRLLTTVEELQSYPPMDASALISSVAESFGLDPNWLHALHRSHRAWSHLHVLGPVAVP